jgi:hypothetical protein
MRRNTGPSAGCCWGVLLIAYYSGTVGGVGGLPVLLAYRSCGVGLEGRLARLLELLRVYRVDRVALHSLVYILERVYNVDVGYGGCSWRLYATGPYCEELEEDLERLARMGYVRVGEGGMLEVEGGDSKVRVYVEGGRVVREAWRLISQSG